MTKDGPDAARLSGQGAAGSDHLQTTRASDITAKDDTSAQMRIAADSGEATAQQPSPASKRFAARLEPEVPGLAGGLGADRPRRGLAGGALASALDGASCDGALARGVPSSSRRGWPGQFACRRGQLRHRPAGALAPAAPLSRLPRRGSCVPVPAAALPCVGRAS